MGQDFAANNGVPEVDFATVHAWPDNWKRCECACSFFEVSVA